MTVVRVGLTGGIAAGKSTVAGWLREAGFRVLDADRLVADLYRPREAGAEAVRRLFGDGFLAVDGAVNRQRLAQHIFRDATARRLLEASIHPLVRKRFEQIAADHQGVLVLEASLLVEAGMAPAFDLVVTVEADPETRLQRARARGLSEQASRRRDAAQTDEATRTAAAHRVLRNDGSLARLRAQVDQLIEDLERMASDDE